MSVVISCSDILSVNYFVRRTQDYKLERRIIVLMKDGRQFILDSQQSRKQFFEKLRLGFRETETIRDWKERNRIINEAVKKREGFEKEGRVFPLVFRVESDILTPHVKDVVWSVVSSEYVDLDVTLVRTAFEKAITSQTHPVYVDMKEWQDSSIHYFKYIFDRHGLILRVGFSGDRSISVLPLIKVDVGFLVSSQALPVFRAVHRYLTKDQILEKMQIVVQEAMKKVTELEQLRQVRKEVPVGESKFELEQLRYKFPQHIVSQVMLAFERRFMDESHLRLSNALAEVAETYKVITHKQRLDLAQESFRVLKND